jgi:hypothetical protein
MDNTGVDSLDYGESVYIGSAQSNWETHSGGEPDNSDRNQIIANTVVDTAAENIDIKEGSSDGVVPGNYLGGDKIASKNSADSWIEIKGNGYLIDSNHGVTTQGWSASHRTERERPTRGIEYPARPGWSESATPAMQTAPGPMSEGRFGSSGGRIRTCDLWVMSRALGGSARRTSDRHTAVALRTQFSHRLTSSPMNRPESVRSGHKSGHNQGDRTAFFVPNADS